MACLAGTTWAWFTVDIENTGNVIQIASVTESVTVTDQSGSTVVPDENGRYNLEKGTYHVSARLQDNGTAADDLNKGKASVYILMSTVDQNGSTEYYYFAFEGGRTEAYQQLEVKSDRMLVNFTVTWIRPASAEQLWGSLIAIGEETADSTAEESAEEETVEQETTEPVTEPEETETVETTGETSASEEEVVPETTEETADATESEEPAPET